MQWLIVDEIKVKEQIEVKNIMNFSLLFYYEYYARNRASRGQNFCYFCPNLCEKNSLDWFYLALQFLEFGTWMVINGIILEFMLLYI